jgi:integrase/recombinase XerD
MRKAPRNCFWRGPVLWGRIKVKGHDIKWSLRTGDIKTAESRVAAERERQIAAVYYGDDRKTCEDVVNAWTDHHISHSVAANTARRYAVSLGQLDRFLPVHLDEINKTTVTSIVDGRRAAGASTATIRRDLTALSSVLEYAIDQDWRAEGDNPALSRLKRLKERRDPIVLPEPADIERMIRRAPAAFGAMIRAAWLTGCRLDELVQAERSRLDHVRKQLTVIGKGNKLRVIDLDSEAYDLLARLPVRLGCKWLFWHHDGSQYRNASSRFAQMVRSLNTRGGPDGSPVSGGSNRDSMPPFRPFRFHDLRHRHAVDWLKAGGSIYALQQRLGHSSVKVTEMYAKFLTAEEADRVKAGAPRFGEQQRSGA